MKNSLSKDISKLINQIEVIQKKHGIETTPDDMPTELDKAKHYLELAVDELCKARIDATIDEVMNSEGLERRR